MTDALETHLQRQTDHSQRFFWHRLRWRAVRGYLPKGRGFELVDVGAGAGLLGSYLQSDRPGATYRFVEPIASLREHLVARFGPEADAGADNGYPGARFVTLLDVLEHQEDDRSFMRDLVAKMPTGSTLLLTVPAMPRLWSDWDVALGHYRRYEPASLRAAVADLPLVEHETSFLFPEMVPLAEVRARRKSRASGVNETTAEFPEVPNLINDLLFVAGCPLVGLRRHWRFGTSLFLAATVSR